MAIDTHARSTQQAMALLGAIDGGGDGVRNGVFMAGGSAIIATVRGLFRQNRERASPRARALRASVQ